MDSDRQETWVRLYRKSKDSQVFTNSDLWKVWTWCLMKASYKERWYSIRTGRGETEVNLMPGQFIFGRKTAAKDLHMKPASVYTRMQKLQKIKNISIQANTHYSIVTVLNWDNYQKRETSVEQAIEQASSNQVATNEQPSSTNKKVNTYKNVNKESINIADRILEFASTLELPAIKGESSRQKVIGTINARLKDGISESDLKNHLSRYEAKKKIHMGYMDRHTEKPEINSLAWCPSTTWRIIDILSPDRFDKYFSIWEEEGLLDIESTIKKYRKQQEKNNATNKGNKPTGDPYCSSDGEKWPEPERY